MRFFVCHRTVLSTTWSFSLRCTTTEPGSPELCRKTSPQRHSLNRNVLLARKLCLQNSVRTTVVHAATATSISQALEALSPETRGPTITHTLIPGVRFRWTLGDIEPSQQCCRVSPLNGITQILTLRPGAEMKLEPLYDTRNTGGRGPYPFGVDPAWHGAQTLHPNGLARVLSGRGSFTGRARTHFFEIGRAFAEPMPVCSSFAIHMVVGFEE